MSVQPSKFAIGVFVTAAILLAVITIVWLGASNYLQKGALYLTYFDESVQGLSEDSNVKYRGVNVGTVREIRVAPDHKLVEVLMKLQMSPDSENNVVAKLRSAGLTGIVFIELDRRLPGDADLSPAISFVTEHPVILSVPSDAKYLLSLVQTIVRDIRHIPFKTIFERIDSIATGVDRYINGEDMRRILVNVASASAHLDRTIVGIDKMAQETDLPGTVTEAKEALRDIRRFVTEIRDTFAGLSLTETAAKIQQTTAEVESRSRKVGMNLQVTAENLQRASETLEVLIERLQTNPSELLFSNPPKPKR